MDAFAILCPGQGMQDPAMFDLAATTPEGRAVIDTFAAAVSIDLLARTRANDALFEPVFAQQALVASALATWHALAPMLPTPAAFAGYSVGEVSAWACAGAWPVARCAEVVALRAQAMQRLGPPDCGMVAVRGLSIEAVRRMAVDIDISIVNGPDQLVVAGTLDELDAAASLFVAAGAATRRLEVHVPSHTARMRDAAAAFADAMNLASCAAQPAAPVSRGIDGLLLRNGDDAGPALSRAICETVRWDACQRTLVERGIRVALELGPGRSLTAIAAETVPELVIRSVEDFRTPAGVVAWLRKSIAA